MAPRIFFKILLATTAFIHMQGVKIFHYLSDILVVAHSGEELGLQCNRVMGTLSNFGWLINNQKSNLIPTQQIEYLGMTFNTQLGHILLPYRKISKLKACVYRMMEFPTLRARDCLTMLGIFTSAFPAVPWARAFKMSFLSQWNRGSLDQKILLPVWIRWV